MADPLLDAVQALAGEELARARDRFEALNSPHEGYAVVLEEVQELQEALTALGLGLDWLWHDVRANSSAGIAANADSMISAAARAAAEAVQVLAVARRFREDVVAGVAA